MYLAGTQCCAIQEISGLSHHATAEEAMRDFCRALQQAQWQKGPLKVPGLITFTAVVGLTTSKTVSDKYKYGQRFKAYILKHKLGKVGLSPIAVNRLNHPTHKVRAFVWSPDDKALNAWYAAHGGLGCSPWD